MVKIVAVPQLVFLKEPEEPARTSQIVSADGELQKTIEVYRKLSIRQ